MLNSCVNAPKQTQCFLCAFYYVSPATLERLVFSGQVHEYLSAACHQVWSSQLLWARCSAKEESVWYSTYINWETLSMSASCAWLHTRPSRYIQVDHVLHVEIWWTFWFLVINYPFCLSKHGQILNMSDSSMHIQKPLNSLCRDHSSVRLTKPYPRFGALWVEHDVVSCSRTYSMKCALLLSTSQILAGCCFWVRMLWKTVSFWKTWLDWCN